MNLQRFLFAAACTAVVSLSASPVYAGWVWTPESGWIGPSGLPLDTPEAQLDYALELFEAREYDDAKAEFRKVLKHYEESREAAEAKYYIGRILEEERDFYKAFKEYRETIQKYPSTKRIDEIIERQYRIGNHFLSGNKRKVFGLAAILPAKHKAIEIFEAIIEDGPFSEYGPRAQYKLGEAYMIMQDYEEAIEAFDEVITRYPESELVDDARYQMALASLKGTFSAGYDQSSTDIALEQLESFLKNYPESELTDEARQRKRKLVERRAEHEYQIARFYERRGKPDAAQLYYQTVVEQYPETSWAPKAVAKLEELKN